MYPVLFNLGDTQIHAYGFLIAVALIVGWVLSLRLARADKLPADILGTGYVASVGGGLLLARVMWLVRNDQFDDIGSLFQLSAGGMSGFGGVLAGLIIGAVYCQNRKIPVWAWLDCAAPAFLFGVALERTAAFLAGADAGHYVSPDFFLAVQFPADSPVQLVQLRDLPGLRVPADASLPVHPSQLYAAVGAAIGAGLTMVVRSRRKYSGQVALFALGYYGVVRYLVEDPFRYDMTPGVAGPVSLGHVTGAVIVILVVATHVVRMGKLAENPQGLVQWTGGPWTPGFEDESKKKTKKKSAKKKSAKKTSAEKTSAKKTSAKKTSGETETSAETDAGSKGADA